MDTTPIVGNLEPLLDVLRSIFSFLVGRKRGSSEESSDMDDTDSDIEFGLRKPLEGDDHSSHTRVEHFFGEPVRFPSSISELLGRDEALEPAQPIPESLRPPIPPLPVPISRNEDKSICLNVGNRFELSIFLVSHERRFLAGVTPEN